MNDIYDEAGQSAWDLCSTEELIEMGLLDEATLEEMFSELGSAIEASTETLTA